MRHCTDLSRFLGILKTSSRNRYGHSSQKEKHSLTRLHDPGAEVEDIRYDTTHDIMTHMRHTRGLSASHPSQHHHRPAFSLSMSPEPRRGSPGNNRFGARGTLKCLNCRNRKARCEFATKDDDCRWCAQRGLTCGDKLLGEKHQIREHRKRLGIGNTPLSTIAAKLELAYPRHTPWEICEMAREILLENGDGPDDLSILSRQNSQSQEDHPFSRHDSVKPEDSPKTPPLSLQSQTFINASGQPQQRSPPRSVPQLEQEITSVITLDHYPPYQDYNFTMNYSATTPIRQSFGEDRDQVFDPSIFTQVSQRIVDAGPWSVPGFSWQESMT